VVHHHHEAAAEKKVSVHPRYLAAFGVVSGLAGVYLGYFSPLIPVVLAIPALVWAADAIRRIAGYGLGTGVPSIGNLSIGMGILAALVGLRYEPAVGAAFAASWGLLYGITIGKLKILEIPVFNRCVTELSTGACVALMCLLSAIAGGYSRNFFDTRLMPTVFTTGFVAVVFWATSLAIAHPFNACLGPAERQGRTLRLALGVAGIDVTLTGLAAWGVSALEPSIMTWETAVTMIFIGVGVWVAGYYSFVKAAMKESASVTWTGYPAVEK